MTALGALPVIVGATCPSAASALATTGLNTVCQVASGGSDLADGAVSQVAGVGIDSVFSALGSWVSDGATWLLAQIGGALGSTTSVDLSASWFTDHYGTMAALGGVMLLPLLLLGIIQSVYRQNASALVRSVVVNVPLAVLLTAVAVKLVELGLAVTDAMSDAVAGGAGLQAGHLMASVTTGLSGATAAGQPAVPTFILFLGSLAVVFGAVMVWIELLIRSAAVYVAVLFLPMALASLAWPAISHWCRRLLDTLVALILGKFVIVSVLSLAVGALTGSGSGDGSFSAVLGGAALLILSAFAPWALFRLLPFVEAGAVGHLEDLSRRARHQVTAPVKGLAQVAMRAASVGSAVGASSGIGGASLLGSAAGPSGLRSHPPGGGRRPGGGGVGVDGSTPGSPPDMGRSSAESTGVGTTAPPAHGIPMHAPHPEATAVAQRMMAELEGGRSGDEGGRGSGPVPGSGGHGGSPAAAAAGQALRPLPRQTGVTHADALGRDELGIKLIAARQPPAHRAQPGGPPSSPAGGSDLTGG